MQTLDSTRRDQVTVEAESVEDALAEISEQFGADAEIMRAQKVHRGGVGGFFAREMVQLTARRRREGVPTPPRPQSGGIADVLERMAQDADAEDSDFRTVLQRELAVDQIGNGGDEVRPPLGSAVGLAEPVAAGGNQDRGTTQTHEHEPAAPLVTESDAPAHEMPPPVVVGPALSAGSEADEESGWASDPRDDSSSAPAAPTIVDQAVGMVVPVEFPREPEFDEAASVEIAEEDANTEGIVASAGEAAANWWRTAEAVDAPDGMGSVAWSTTSLLRLGLPAPVIGAVAGLDSNDDLGWIDAIAAAVAPHCGPLPDVDVIIVGPHAERLAEPLGLPLIRSGDMAPYAGSFCAMVEDTVQDRQWLEFVRGGRGIHLVVGDESWHDLLIDEPVAVSWVGESAVVDALYLAFTLGATLGFGTVDGFVSSMVRPQPTDVALAVRRIVGRR